jgi:Uma2 family endonuclease
MGGMSTINPIGSLAPGIPPEPIARLSVEQYHDMIRNGILSPDNPLELLEGWLVTKMPKNPPHRFSTRALRKALEKILPPGWIVDSQEPVTTAESEPEPDISVIRGNEDDYRARHPDPKDVGMTSEVADTTLLRDRTWKKRIYARARIPVYWIVNLIDRQVEVYTDPTGPAAEPDYRQRQDYLPGDSVPVVVDGREIGRLAVSDLLP